MSSSFVWGAATAAYQIEGAVDEDGRGPSIWDAFTATPGAIARGETGAIAVDHYHRMPDDVALMRDLGLDAYRFSIAWPRIMPEGAGRVNQAGLDFYKRLLEELAKSGIKAYATLYHWDLPQALQDRWGGWIGRDTAYAFAEYADVVSRALGDGIDSWITLNEPWVSAYFGYGWGLHAPGYRSMQLGMQASHHLLLAHGLSVPVLRANARSRVGITLNFSPIESASDAPEDIEAAERADANVNLWFLEPLFRGRYPANVLPGLSHAKLRVHDGDMRIITAPIDFLGVNYYTRFLIEHDSLSENPLGRYVENPHAERTEMGWEVRPQSFHDILTRIHRDYAPTEIIITENGAAFPDLVSPDGRIHDDRRIAYYDAHIGQVFRAIGDGVPITGYFAWSLMDNFEWAEGYRPRFGLVYVDYETQRRIVKDSGYWYRDRAQSTRTAPGPAQ